MPNFWKKITGLFQGEKPPDDLLAGKTILTVDDEPSQRHFIESILVKKGARVLTAENGTMGLQIARREKPNLILLDLCLPDINGKQICQTLKNDLQTKGIPIIFLTGSSKPGDVIEEYDVGAELHLAKPINAKELVDQVFVTLSEKSYPS